MARKINPKTLEMLQKRRWERQVYPTMKAEIVSGPSSKTEPEPKPKPSSKTLCVGTILCKNDELSKKWLDLQLRYLKATTQDFDHVTYISYSGSSPAIDRMNTHVLPQSGKNKYRHSQGHIHGLETLQDYFLKTDYQYYLFLDCDAFPIRRGWQEILNERFTRGFHLATLIRPENLEQRCHCSVLYIKSKHLAKLRWKFEEVGKDLLGRKEGDVKLLRYQDVDRDKVFVMLRSNKFNVHPLLCGVYYDTFYHHGCGSGRNFNMRARPYWKHVVEGHIDIQDTIRQLMDEPSEFISELAGWCPDEYPRV